MRIAVCDDEKETRGVIGKYITRLYPEAQIEYFGSGDGLLFSDADFDIIYLDIKMNGTNGMDTALALRERGCGAVMIFVTAMPEYVYRAFDAGAFHYLLKPIDRVKFYEVLQKAWEQRCALQNADMGKFLMIKNGRDREKIFLKDIICAEIFNRKIIIHTVSGDIEYYGRINELEKQAGSDFFRTHRGIL